MITLYGISTSRAGRCVWALEEIGIPYTHVPIHFNDGSTRTPAYRAVDPNERIPTLVDGELVLWESLAINHYLADRYGGGLRPRTPEAAVRALMWSLWGNNEIENLLRAPQPALQKAWGGRRPEMDPANLRPLGEVDPRRGF